MNTIACLLNRSTGRGLAAKCATGSSIAPAEYLKRLVKRSTSFIPYQDNNYFLEINRGTCGAYDTNVSFYQDVAAYTQPADRYYMRVRVRRNSAVGGTINLHLWALWVPNSQIIDQWVYIPADGAWHEYEYSNTVPNPGNWIMRAEVYLYDSDNFDFDGFQIWGGAGN